ncbi:MAG: hypothetical protein JNM63_03750 [Spirochaetia bacterium]|nr:hypothetical protein [Spirochaetia bacterium]
MLLVPFLILGMSRKLQGDGLDNPGLNFLSQDFIPGAVARGGAYSTYFDEPASIYYNPAASVWVPKAKVAFTFSHSFLPDAVYLQHLTLFIKPKTIPFYFSIVHFTSDVMALGKNSDENGELNARTLMFSFNTGNKIGKDVSWGVTTKFITSRYFTTSRNYLAVDGGLSIDLPKANIRGFAGVRNLGFDLTVIQNLLSLAPSSANINATNVVQTPVGLPLTIALGFQYQLFKIFQFYADVDYSIIESIMGQGLLAIRPKIGISFTPIPEISVNVGRTFRNNAALGYFTFGVDLNFKFDKLPIGFQYAFEPIPDFSFNHYLGITFKFI